MNKLEQAARQALEALEVYEIKLNSRLCNEAITALREALAEQEEKPQSDNCCKEADGCPTELAVLQRFWRQAQPQVAPDGRVAKTVFTLEDVQKAAEMGRAAGIAEAEALAQPQGEWVDLTDDDCLDLALDDGIVDSLCDPYDKFKTGDDYGSVQYDVIRLCHKALAKFKSKNTPPVVPQGDKNQFNPDWDVVADMAAYTRELEVKIQELEKQGEAIVVTYTKGYNRGFESGVEATKEKVAKFFDRDKYHNFGVGHEIAAAIRSMK